MKEKDSAMSQESPGEVTRKVYGQVIFELKHHNWKEASLQRSGVKYLFGRGHNRCKDLEAEKCLMCLRERNMTGQGN